MAVDIGYIVKYDRIRKCGLLEGIFAPGKFTKFTFSQIYDESIYTRLEKGSNRGLRIWYIYNEDIAIFLWSNPDGMDQEDYERFKKQLEEYWKNVEQSKPDWLDSVTKQLGGLELHSKLTKMRDDLGQQQRKTIIETLVEKKPELIERKSISNSDEGDLLAVKIESDATGNGKSQFAQPTISLQQDYYKQHNLKQQPLAEITSRAEAIKAFCIKRGITTLFHFTRFNHLESILRNGLLSQEELKNLLPGEQPIFNDNKRLDNCPGATCLTISFPNWQMFYSLRIKPENQNVQWVVLALQSDILWELDCAFNQTNAANKAVSIIGLEQRRKPEALSSMFADTPTKRREDLHIPDQFTTDPQAEVLVFSLIPIMYFESIYFGSLASKDEAFSKDYSRGFQDKFSTAPDYFAPRSDYQHWKKQNDSSDHDSWPNEMTPEDIIFADPSCI